MRVLANVVLKCQQVLHPVSDYVTGRTACCAGRNSNLYKNRNVRSGCGAVRYWSHCIRFWSISYTGVLGGPIGRPRSAERVVILHTLYGRIHGSF